MSYSTAKAKFEATVQSMQADLKRYVDSGTANQKAVNIKTDIINKLVEYYEEANKEITHLQAEKTNMSIRYNRLHADAGKLVTFTELHGINPNQIFFYKQEELSQMQYHGLRIQLPAIDLNNVEVAEIKQIGGFDYPVIGFNIEEPETDLKHDHKKQLLNQFCRK